jgi:enoyl-CoA hydratase/carnithine racemase
MSQARVFHTLLVESNDEVSTVTLNRPERRNAIGPQMVNELLYALDDAFQDKQIRAIVIKGAGKAFCAGGDFSQMTGGAEQDALPPKGDYADLLRVLCRAPKPILAQVHGPAMGGGLGLVAACTFAIASEDAVLGTPEINVGLFPMMIMAVLARLVPKRKLLEMMLFGEKLSAAKAQDFGLLNTVVPAAELQGTVNEFLAKIRSKSPHTLRLGLEAYADQADSSLEEALPMLQERLALCLASDDAREGLMAFLEKRKPTWTGK